MQSYTLSTHVKYCQAQNKQSQQKDLTHKTMHINSPKLPDPRQPCYRKCYKGHHQNQQIATKHFLLAIISSAGRQLNISQHSEIIRVSSCKISSITVIFIQHMIRYSVRDQTLDLVQCESRQQVTHRVLLKLFFLNKIKHVTTTQSFPAFIVLWSRLPTCRPSLEARHYFSQCLDNRTTDHVQ